jgi:hypothetical protein
VNVLLPVTGGVKTVDLRRINWGYLRIYELPKFMGMVEGNVGNEIGIFSEAINKIR